MQEISIGEEKSVLKQVIISSKSYEWIKEDVLVAIIKTAGNVFTSLKVCGKTFLEWICMTTAGSEQVVVEENIIEEIKAHVGEKKYIFIVYDDTPFLEKSTYVQIMDYFACNNLNSMELPRGFVYRADYFVKQDELGSMLKKSFGEDDFNVVDNNKKLMKFYQYQNTKIIKYHKNNGVILYNEETISIEADVEIESGCIIYANNTIKGQTYIGKNVILDVGNYIVDCIISDGVNLLHSYVEKSKITENKKIGPYEKIVNKKV